jgi:hypothetical protein
MAGAMMKRAVAILTIAASAACADTPPAADGGAGLDARDVPADRAEDAPVDRAVDGVADVFGLPDVVDGLPDDRPPLPGVSCVTRHRRDAGCTQATTTEPDVRFWLTLVNLEAHNESALGTNSAGIHLYFGSFTVFSGPVFVATDDTYTLYQRREQVPGMDTGTGRRAGARLDFTMNARRGGLADGGCPLPDVEITCSGSTWLGR